MSDTLNRTTPDGRELGELLATFCDDAEPDARLKMPALPPRCESCAFRQGKHAPNGSPETLMDALKCVLEGAEFYCHQKHRKGELCAGWTMMMLAQNVLSFTKVPWPFSDEPVSP